MQKLTDGRPTSDVLRQLIHVRYCIDQYGVSQGGDVSLSHGYSLPADVCPHLLSGRQSGKFLQITQKKSFWWYIPMTFFWLTV